ncbi:MAG: hypothetical protein DRP27_01110 [Thermotogae bacterium]|nr:MAG: hypothetical protein DRP27_01110 [Thermotogota bacterium]
MKVLRFFLAVSILLTLASMILAGRLVVFSNGDTVTGKYDVRDSRIYIPVESVTSFAKAFTLTTVGDAGYMVNARKDIAFLDGSTGNVTLNFLEDHPKGCFITREGTKTTLMVNLEFVQDFLGLLSYQKGDFVFLGRAFPVLTELYESEEGLELLFDKEIVPSMITVEPEKTGVVLEIAPVNGIANALLKLETPQVEYDDDTKRVRLFFKEIEAHRLQHAVLGRSLRVSFGPPPGYDLYEKIDEGLTWYRKVEGLDGATLTLNVLEIDPTRFDVKLELANGKVGGGEKVTDMVARTGAIAGLNGGYFDPATMFPIGFIVKDGHVLHLPFSVRPVFLKTKDGKYQIRRVRYEMNIRLGTVLFYVKGVNTPAKGDALLFTSEYSDEIPSREGFQYFVGNGTWIEAKGYVQRIESGKYVFMVSDKYAELLQAVRVGDPFRIIEISDLEGTREVDFAVEGGPLLIEDGSPVPNYAEEKALYSSYVTDSYAPRTVVGITNSGKIAFMTISGEKIRGPNYDKLVELMLRYDFKDAMALDGGGSSVLVVKGQVVNKNPNKEIPVPTGLLVFKRE